MINPELIIFDLVGTTVQENKDAHRVLQRVFKKMHMRISIAEANQVLSKSIIEGIRLMLMQHKYPYISELLVLEIYEHFVIKMVEYYSKHLAVHEESGASEVFAACKQRGIKIVVVTQFDLPIATPLWHRMGWEKLGLADALITNVNMTNAPSYSGVIYRAMQLTGVKELKKVARVGTIANLEESDAADCGWVIEFLSEHSAHVENKITPTHTIRMLKDLYQIFGWSGPISGFRERLSFNQYQNL